MKLSHRLIRYMRDRRQHRERWVAALRNAQIPLRLINGLEDPVSGKHLVDHYRSEIPDADVIELPGIGHYPHTEAPDQVLAAFLAFHEHRCHD